MDFLCPILLSSIMLKILEGKELVWNSQVPGVKGLVVFVLVLLVLTR